MPRYLLFFDAYNTYFGFAISRGVMLTTYELNALGVIAFDIEGGGFDDYPRHRFDDTAAILFYAASSKLAGAPRWKCSRC